MTPAETADIERESARAQEEWGRVEEDRQLHVVFDSQRVSEVEWVEEWI